MHLYFKALYKDDTSYSHEFNHPDKTYNGEMNLPNVKRYFIVDEQDKLHHGVDVENRILIINGNIIHTNLPQGEYQLISFKRTETDFSAGMNGNDVTKILSKIEKTLFCFGLQANIDGVNHKMIVFINPNGSFTLNT